DLWGILSGPRVWLVSGFDHFLSGLAPGRFAKIQKICPDWDLTVCTIDGGPVPASQIRLDSVT
ncbi:hypothetical protein BYT27DRAFT_7176556, partial [Phlegmacium glaucopus]